jgi:hypothetical protein
MAILLSNVSNALQKVIMPYIQDNFPKQTILLDQMKRNSGVTFMNDHFYAPVRTSRHGGVTNLANDGNSLVSGKSSIGQASVDVKILTGTFDISKLTLDATKTAKGAVENQLTFQATSLASDFAKNVNRQMFSDGYGIVAQISGSAANTTGTLALPGTSSSGSIADDNRMYDAYGSVNGDVNPYDYIYPDMILQIGSATAAAGTYGTVSSITTGNVVNFTGTSAITVGAAVYIADGSQMNSGTTEIQGMRLALSSSTAGSYANLARTTYGWSAQVGTTAGALTLSAMEQQYLAAKKYSQAGDQFAIFVNKTLYKKYGDLLTAMRRTVNESDLLGGWTGLEFAAGAGKVGVFLDYDVPDGEVLIVNLDSWTICQVSDLNWLEDAKEGSLFRRPDKITYQATMVWFTNLLCRAPGANGRLTQKTA